MGKDFSSYQNSKIYYSGSERKESIIIDNELYMIKYQKKTASGKRNNHISEFIGSHIFQLCGFNVHNTFLGYRNGEEVVACKDFNNKGKQFVPFNALKECTLDQVTEPYGYTYENIMQILRNCTTLTKVEETISIFWQIYIMDALLGNFDRHGSNWGFIKENNRYSLAPVFDNGSCLFPSLTDENEMKKIIESEEETNKRIYKFPTSQINLNRRKSSYFEVINSLQFSECNDALKNVMSRINMEGILQLVDDTPLISETQKLFYKRMLSARYEKILKNSFDKLISLRGDL